MEVIIRPMQEADVETVWQLERAIFKDAWSKESFLVELQQPEISYPLVAVSGEKIVGYAVVWYFSGEIHIGNIAVSPQWRGKGIASKLLAYIFERFKDYQAAYLEVRASNQAAINLYLKFNFRKLYLRQAYYSDGEDAWVMVREKKDH